MPGNYLLLENSTHFDKKDGRGLIYGSGEVMFFGVVMVGRLSIGAGIDMFGDDFWVGLFWLAMPFMWDSCSCLGRSLMGFFGMWRCPPSV